MVGTTHLCIYVDGQVSNVESLMFDNPGLYLPTGLDDSRFLVRRNEFWPAMVGLRSWTSYFYQLRLCLAIDSTHPRRVVAAKLRFEALPGEQSILQ
jgi:hypothetical protein